jgi:hypothetical protein
MEHISSPGRFARSALADPRERRYGSSRLGVWFRTASGGRIGKQVGFPARP